MKNIHSINFLFLFLALGISISCTKRVDPAKPDIANNQSADNLKQKVGLEVKGSSTVFPVCKDASAEYARATGRIVFCDGGGSGFGVKFAVGGGLGMVSRSLKPDEEAQGVVAQTIGYDGIAIVVNSQSKLKKLSIVDIKRIYTGEAKNWKEFGGESAAIETSGPNKDHGTYGAFIEILDMKSEFVDADGKKHERSLFPESYQGFQSHHATVNFVSEHKAAIGFIPVGLLEETLKSKNGKIRGVVVNSIAPTQDTVRTKTYPIIRPLQFVWHNPIKDDAKKFLDFIISDEGQKIVERQNYVGSSPKRAPGNK